MAGAILVWRLERFTRSPCLGRPPELDGKKLIKDKFRIV
jgi:hypothetical protein